MAGIDPKQDHQHEWEAAYSELNDDQTIEYVVLECQICGLQQEDEIIL